MSEMHEVMVPCCCDTVEQCRTELYVSDVRIAIAEIDDLLSLQRTVERVWGASMRIMREV